MRYDKAKGFILGLIDIFLLTMLVIMISPISIASSQMHENISVVSSKTPFLLNVRNDLNMEAFPNEETILENDTPEEETVSLPFILLLIGFGMGIVFFPLSLVFLHSYRPKKFPEAIPVEFSVIDRKSEEDIVFLSSVSPKSSPVPLIFGIIVLFIPVIPFILTSSESWILSYLNFLGVSTGFLMLSFCNIISVKEPILREKNAWIMFLLALIGLLSSVFLVLNHTPNQINNVGYEWLEQIMLIVFFLLAVSGANFIVAGLHWKVVILDKKKRSIRVTTRTLFWQEIFELPCNQLTKLVLYPGVGAERNVKSFLEFHLIGGKKFNFSAGGVFSQELTNPHALGTMLLKEGCVKKVEDKIPVWPVEKKSLTSAEVKDNILVQPVQLGDSNNIIEKLKEHWKIKQQISSTILESKTSGYLITIIGVIFLSIPCVLLILSGFLSIGLSFFIANNIPNGLIILIMIILLFSLGIALLLLAIWLLYQVILFYFQRVRIILKEDYLKLEMIPTIRQPKSSCYYYEQIEKIESEKRRLGRVAVKLSNYFMDVSFVLCKTEEEAKTLSRFITFEIQRLYQWQRKSKDF